MRASRPQPVLLFCIVGAYLRDSPSYALLPKNKIFHRLCNKNCFCVCVSDYFANFVPSAFPFRKPQWAEVGQTYISVKAFLYASVLTIRESRKFICKSKTKQQRTLHEVYYIPLVVAFGRLFARWQEERIIYLHWRGAFGVARFDLQGNARAYGLWNE